MTPSNSDIQPNQSLFETTELWSASALHDALTKQHDLTMRVAEAQEFATILPEPYRTDFLLGKRYQTGSDYTPAQLSRIVAGEPCPHSTITGTTVANGSDDFDVVGVCDACGLQLP